MDHPCKIAFNQKLLHKFKKCVNFQVALKQHCATKSLNNEACLPVWKNMALAGQPQLLQFQPQDR
jgi:hypothetical protein